MKRMSRRRYRLEWHTGQSSSGGISCKDWKRVWSSPGSPMVFAAVAPLIWATRDIWQHKERRRWGRAWRVNGYRCKKYTRLRQLVGICLQIFTIGVRGKKTCSQRTLDLGPVALGIVGRALTIVETLPNVSGTLTCRLIWEIKFGSEAPYLVLLEAKYFIWH